MATLSKNLILPEKILKNEGVVILSLKKYEKIKEAISKFNKQKSFYRKKRKLWELLLKVKKNIKKEN